MPFFAGVKEMIVSFFLSTNLALHNGTSKNAYDKNDMLSDQGERIVAWFPTLKILFLNEAKFC